MTIKQSSDHEPLLLSLRDGLEMEFEPRRWPLRHIEIDQENKCIVFKNGYGYWISFDRLKDYRKNFDWILHLAEKDWFTDETLLEFIGVCAALVRRPIRGPETAESKRRRAERRAKRRAGGDSE